MTVYVLEGLFISHPSARHSPCPFVTVSYFKDLNLHPLGHPGVRRATAQPAIPSMKLQVQVAHGCWSVSRWGNQAFCSPVLREQLKRLSVVGPCGEYMCLGKPWSSLRRWQGERHHQGLLFTVLNGLSSL